MTKLETYHARRPAFDGPQLWIHHNPEDMKLRPHRRQVFAHIQKHYLPWRRGEHKSCSREATATPDTQSEELPSSPVTILGKGNSDPFQSYAVNIGAHENELFTFYRDVFLPSQYLMDSDQPQFPQLAEMQKHDWEDCIGGFADKGIAHALLARWGQIVGRCTPSVRKATLIHQYRGTQLLRTRLIEDRDFQTQDDYLHISHLFSAETFGRNLYGAQAHGNMLRRMFENAWERGTLDYKLLSWQIHNDAQTAAIFLCRPIFDVEEWLPTVFAPLYTWAAKNTPQVSCSNDSIDPAVLDPTLLQHLKDARTYWASNDNLEASSPASTIYSPESITWRIYQAIINIGCFINLHLSLKSQLTSPSLPKKLQRKLLVQQYLTLASIYLLKSLHLNPIIFNVPVLDCRPAILPALRSCLEASDAICSWVHRKKYQNARFWALYVGALAEQQGLLPQLATEGGKENCDDDYELGSMWFKRQLAKQAVAMQILSWSEAKPILERFLFSERIAPDGALWFEKMIFEP